MANNPGCLSGLLKLFLLDRLFNWLQSRFGFGSNSGCFGCGCGVILMLIFLSLACWIIGGTDWLRIGF